MFARLHGESEPFCSLGVPFNLCCRLLPTASSPCMIVHLCPADLLRLTVLLLPPTPNCRGGFGQC